MKVLKKTIVGNDGWIKEFVCDGSGGVKKGCGAILLVSEYDLYNHSFFAEGSVTVHLTNFTCPKCGAETNIGALFKGPEARGRRDLRIIKEK